MKFNESLFDEWNKIGTEEILSRYALLKTV